MADEICMVQMRHTDLVDRICMVRAKHTDLVDRICMVQARHTDLVDEICMVRAENKDLVDEICMPRLEKGYSTFGAGSSLRDLSSATFSRSILRSCADWLNGYLPLRRTVPLR